MMLLLAHWSGCVQYMIPYMQGFPENSWVAINNLENSPVGVRYSWSLFKSISHMLCIGYGRFPPASLPDVWMTIVSMLIGASFYALFIGHISSHVLTANSPARLYNEKIKQVEDYMRYRRLPIEMQTRVMDYYDHKYQGKLFNEDAILNELSDCLRSGCITNILHCAPTQNDSTMVYYNEVTNYICKSLVESVQFFQDADPYYVSSIIMKLELEVFMPNDDIVRIGTMGTKMYFIQHGVVDVMDENGKTFVTLDEGSHFGEICLLNSARRVATIRAVTVCDLYSLSQEHFKAILEEFPEARKVIEKVAAERLANIGNITNSPQILAQEEP